MRQLRSLHRGMFLWLPDYERAGLETESGQKRVHSMWLVRRGLSARSLQFEIRGLKRVKLENSPTPERL